jgi:hypothetical protein
MHAGWPEISGIIKPTRKFNYKKEKTVLFLSQVEGAKLHRLEDLKSICNRFMSILLNSDIKDMKFNIRLRNETELKMLDETLVNRVLKSKIIYFSYIKDSDISDVLCDMIVSATSTGILYAQFMDVACMQITSVRLHNHWPFKFVNQNSMIMVDDMEETLIDSINKTFNEYNGQDFYDECSAANKLAILDKIYNDDKKCVHVQSSYLLKKDIANYTFSEANKLYRSGHYHDAFRIYEYLKKKTPLSVYRFNSELALRKL